MISNHNMDADMLDFPDLSENPMPRLRPLTAANSRALSFINNTIDDIDAGLGTWPHGEVKVVLKRIAKVPQNHGSTTRAGSESGKTFDYTRVKAPSRQMRCSWPGNTPEEAWRFGMPSTENLSSSLDTRSIRPA